MDIHEYSLIFIHIHTYSYIFILFANPTKRGELDLPFVTVALDLTSTIMDQSYTLILHSSHIVKSNIDTIRCFHGETICLYQTLLTL
jgi:hypothetical protein